LPTCSSRGADDGRPQYRLDGPLRIELTHLQTVSGRYKRTECGDQCRGGRASVYAKAPGAVARELLHQFRENAGGQVCGLQVVDKDRVRLILPCPRVADFCGRYPGHGRRWPFGDLDDLESRLGMLAADWAIPIHHRRFDDY
jgi:hypothetical protein